MKIKDIMTKDPYILKETDTLKDAARLFVEKMIDAAPVINAKQILTGLVTKGHILSAVVNNLDFNTLIKDIMETQVTTLNLEENIDNINFLEAGRFPVVNANIVEGIVTSSDLFQAYYQTTRGLEEELKTVIESAYNAIITIDKAGNVQVFNKSAENLLDISRHEILGKQLTSLLPDSNLINIVKTGKTEPSHRIYYGEKTLLSNRAPIIIDGEVVGAVAVLQDISEIENIYAKLYYTQELKEELDAIIESSFDGIFVTDGRGKTIRINEAYSRITGIEPDEILGKTMDELVKQGVYDKSASILVLAQGEPVTISQEVKTGKTVLVTGNPVFDEEGKLFRIVTNVRDITELNNLRQELKQAYSLSQHYQEELSKYRIQDKYVMNSRKSKELVDLLIRLGKVDSTVLIQGESGVGKEVVAEILHNNSLRKDKPLVKINCGAIPESLLESELFGYESGAFTGAKKGGKTGIFEIANGGTLLLDEIGELPLALQVTLLRVIQEKEITRVGGTEAIPIDVRLLAATNRDLYEMVQRNEFRNDLFYRLNVVPITVPPLRERKEEIPALVTHFMHVFNNKYGFNKRLNEDSLQILIQHDWPGNIRELENVIERLVVTSSSDIIEVSHLAIIDEDVLNNHSTNQIPDLKIAIENLEMALIERALKEHHTTREAAKALGISQPTVVRKAAKYGINLQKD